MISGRLEIVEQGMPWDFHCQCRHVAASHWYATGNGLVTGHCTDCGYDVAGLKCRMFKADNLIHLEMKAYEHSK
jgi:hypothetical protein